MRDRAGQTTNRLILTCGFFAGLLLVVVVTSTPFEADAATPTVTLSGASRTAPPDPHRWRFALVPYFWLVGVNGDAGIRDFETSIDTTFFDLKDHLNFGFMINGEVHKGRLGLFVNPIFARLQNDKHLGLPNGVSIDIETTVDIFLFNFGLTYRVWEGVLGRQPDALSLALEPYIGARYFDVNTDLDIQPGPDFDENERWVAPVFGVRTFWDLTERVNVQLFGDIGGFGVSNLDLTWQAVGVIGFRIRLFQLDSNLLLGYRAIGQDYDDGKFTLDAIMHGTVIGLGMYF